MASLRAQCPLGAGLAFATKYEDEVLIKRPTILV